MMNQSMDIQVSSPHGDADEVWLNALWQSEWGGDIELLPYIQERLMKPGESNLPYL